jgi:hypothetical protein
MWSDDMEVAHWRMMADLLGVELGSVCVVCFDGFAKNRVEWFEE